MEEQNAQDRFVRNWLVSLALGITLLAGFTFFVPDRFKMPLGWGMLFFITAAVIGYILISLISWKAVRVERAKRAPMSLKAQLIIVGGGILAVLSGVLISFPRAEWPQCITAVLIGGAIGWLCLRLYARGAPATK